MFKKIIVLAIMLPAFLAGTSLAPAADLVWDYDTHHDRTDGFTVYYSDPAGEEYNVTFPAAEAVVDGEHVKWGPIEDRLNLHPGVIYAFALQRYNASGPSGRSNVVEFGLDAYFPPTDRTPEPASSAPSAAGDLRLE